MFDINDLMSLDTIQQNDTKRTKAIDKKFLVKTKKKIKRVQREYRNSLKQVH